MSPLPAPEPRPAPTDASGARTEARGVTFTADVSGFENGVEEARIATLELAVATLTKRAEQAEGAVQRVRDLAEDMRTWCSPHGVAADYAKRIFEALDQPEETS